jgi:hypothetical protein
MNSSCFQKFIEFDIPGVVQSYGVERFDGNDTPRNRNGFCSPARSLPLLANRGPAQLLNFLGADIDTGNNAVPTLMSRSPERSPALSEGPSGSTFNTCIVSLKVELNANAFSGCRRGLH